MTKTIGPKPCPMNKKSLTTGSQGSRMTSKGIVHRLLLRLGQLLRLGLLLGRKQTHRVPRADPNDQVPRVGTPKPLALRPITSLRHEESNLVRAKFEHRIIT